MNRPSYLDAALISRASARWWSCRASDTLSGIQEHDLQREGEKRKGLNECGCNSMKFKTEFCLI
jgi:hypothetical protein